ncbi:MAG: hypothetical protein JNK41_13365 [Saprospiraceae bacterium]|nr:hypothetical protein [Saprospiraceae bacterium]
MTTNKTSQHILNTSATLLGFCLVVITSVHSNNHAADSFVDEFTSVVSLILIFSCLYSFYSIQTSKPTNSKRSEKIAELLFGIALMGILIIILLLLFKVID